MRDLSPLEITKRLVAFNTENHLADTREISNYISNILEENSLKYKFLKKKNRVYLLSEIGRGKNKLVFYGHSDVVEAGNYEKWTTAPYKPTIKNGNLYGRGTSDMKGGVGAAISTFIDLSHNPDKLNGSVQLLICPDEEDFDDTKLLPTIIKQSNATACIMGEPHYDDIMIGEKGEIDLRLHAFGKTSHGSTPASGIDANIILDNFIHELKNRISGFNKNIRIADPKISKLIKRSNALVSNQFGLNGIIKKNFIKNNPAGTITVNVGCYEAGHHFNTVPDEAEARIVIMVPYRFDYNGIQKLINSLIIKHHNLVKADISWASNASLTSPQEKIVKAMEKAYKEVKKKKPNLVFDTGSTDASFYRKCGIPTVVYGPGYFFNAHTYNEYISIKELNYSKEIYKKAAQNFLS